MNQYKIGDTVWTRKRGKCTVADSTGWRIRPYRIKAANGKHYYPVAENLYPSEAAMNAARRNEVANKYLSGLPKITIYFSALEPYPSGWMTTDPIQPKFKVGDAVYRNGQKYIVISISGQDVFYYTIKNEGMTRYSVKESDLRYWRETTFHTRVVHNNTTKEFDADRFNTQGFDMKKVKYIGHSHGSDIFIYNADTNHATILYGYKGDDI